ncbi:Cu-oxidase-domain-containing protein [Mycena crocata]|nr:Cu-oxidase-domain-containing protein [Mycena crocata]
MQFLSFSFLPLALHVAAQTSRPQKFNDITLDIVNTPAAPDGFTRSIVSANGTVFPGPLIRATKGDTLRVTVNNQLSDPMMRRSMTIDFDGIFFDTPNVYNEGTPFVTTCPFGPGVSTNQTGSYWYHSQLGMQYADGLRGPLVIYDPNDPQAHLYDVDNEDTIWFISDWWHNSTIPMLSSYEATQIIPGLFNGKGRYNGGPTVEYDVTAVQTGKRYRFRLINASARSDFTVSIDNHTMTVIAVNGVDTQPREFNVVDILAGQRYDVVVTADQPVGNYWINSILGGGTPRRNPNLNTTFSRGILHYEGAEDLSAVVLNEFDLKPLVPIPAPPFDVELTFLTSMTVNKTEWNINNISYISPEVPTLLKVLEGASTDADFDKTENTFVVPANTVIQITFPSSLEDGLHPFHLHSSNFWVIKSNGSDIINEVDPIRRDTVAAGAGGTTIRFRTDKAVHCHIFWHMNAGLASVINIGPDETRVQVHPTGEWNDLCDAYNALPADVQ